MAKITTLLLILFSLNSSSQNKSNLVLDWSTSSKYYYQSFDVKIPIINNNGFRFDFATKKIYFNLLIPQTQFVNENSLVISNIVYKNISIAELGELDLKEIPSNINAKLVNLEAREKIDAVISIAPIIKEGNNYLKVISFEYDFNNNNISRRAILPPITKNSVLATGDWYRFYVQKSGVYLLNKSFLSSLGIDISNIDPRNLKIYGNGGKMLPLSNSIEYPDDLTENSIEVNGESDGVFNDGDSVVFYADGTDNWNEESQTFVNLFEEKAFYYINIQGSQGKRIQTNSQPTANATITINDFNDTVFFEKDLVNLGKLGRSWFGDSFDSKNEQIFNFNIPNVVTTKPMNLEVNLAARSNNQVIFQAFANDVNAGNINLSQGSLFYSIGTINRNITPAPNVNIKLVFDNRGVPSSSGFLDKIIIKSHRFLAGYGKQFRFENNLSATNAGLVGVYQFTNSAAIGSIWNINDINNVTRINNSSNNLSFKADLGILQKYVAIDFNDLYTPLKENEPKVTNQDLKGQFFDNAGNFKDIDYLIVTPDFLRSKANNLADFHRNNSGMKVFVASLEFIYKEFSSGKQDVGAIRNFVKWIYFNATDDSKRIKYLNLFGDASYDFKDRIKDNTNIVPIYEATYGQYVSESSFASDDFFGCMTLNEGNLSASSLESLDIAVGRMIVSSEEQADEMVNKVIDYHDPKSYGIWRNNCVFVADDPSAQASGDNQLQYNQNKLADQIQAEKPFLNTKKILIDSYVQEASAGGFRYPKAREDFFNAFTKGALVISYLGHGGEDGLTQERVWEKIDGQNLFNQFKYPLFITLTCDFSRFDNPTKKTGGEFTYWNPKGGAISMITTIREVSQTTAQFFSFTFSKELFAYGSNNYVSIAEALRLAKNKDAGGEKVIFYVGDPALKLAIPQPKIVLTKINDQIITGAVDDLKSLSYVKLSGEVLDENNNPLTDYNGEMAVNIFDKNIPRNTLRNDGANAVVNDANLDAPIMPFTTIGESVFRGNASITNGNFEFGFVVPRDIRIPLGNGRISFYSKKNQTLADKTGINLDIKIGGVNANAVADTTPPTTRLYMNDETFVNGGFTNQSPIFLAFINDENGINTASGIGHDIVAILDGKVTTPFVLNDYYETELNDYKRGKLKFNFRDLTIGLHTLTFKAWDVYNNLVTSELQFIVVGDETLTLTNVLNYPNPFVNYTQFWFTHNRPFEPLDVQVQIMTITGKVVCTKNQVINTTGFLSREISWDGKDDFGDRIGKGVYVYKLTVKSVLTDSITEKYEKLVIL